MVAKDSKDVRYRILVFNEHSELAHTSRVEQVALKECSALKILGGQHFTFDLVSIFVFLFVVFFFEGVFRRLHKEVIFCGSEITLTNAFSGVFVC